MTRASRSPASRSRPSTSSAASASRSDATFTDLQPDRRAAASPRSRAAASARRTWRSRPRRPRSPRGRRSAPSGRARYLHRLADLIDANVERLAAVECARHGDAAPLAARAGDLAGRAQLPRLRRPRGRATRSGSGSRTARGTASMRMPSGPAVVITPWNAPFMLSTWKTAPALAAGLHGRAEAGGVVAALVLAPRRPRRRGGLPARRLQRRAGDRRGDRRGATSRIPARGASRSRARPRRRGTSAPPRPANLVPFTGELGGKGPLLVFADADLEAAARKAAGQYDDAGQVCLAGHAPPRRGVACATRSSSSSTASPTSTSSATRATTRPPSRR